MTLIRMWPAAAAVLALLGACATDPASRAVSDPAPVFADDGTPLGQLPGDVRPSRYALDLTIDPAQEMFSGEARIDVMLTQPTDAIWMHADGIVAEAPTVRLPDGRVIAARLEQRNDTGSALLTLDETAPAGEAVLEIAYQAPFTTDNYGLFREERDGAWYAATQFQPIAARMAFPGFDEPAFKVPFDITVTARTGDVVITNAPETDASVLEDGWTKHTFATTEPLPTYLIAFAVGPYDLVEWEPLPANAVRGAATPLRAIAVAGLGDRLAYALDNTAGILAPLESYFDVPYPYAKLDLIAMPSSFGGAMENAAAVTYDEFLLLMDESAPLSQRRAYTYVHAHELAHMWFGDLVTPEWWTDIWLNESFADWAAYKAAAAHWPEGEFDRSLLRAALGAMAEDSLAATRQIREPVVRDAAITDSFDGITYDKGAGVLAMFEGFVGADAFREGVRTHMDRFPHGVANAEDFMTSVADGSGNAEVVPAIRSFIEQPGVPLIETSLSCPANGAPRVRVRQSRYSPLGSTIDADASLWRVPVCVAHMGADGDGRVCALLTRRESTIALDAESCPDAVHPNAGGAGYYRFALDEAGWAALAEHVDALSAPEALTMVDSLDAAFRAGAASADAYVAGLAALAERPEWDVVESVADNLEAITEILDDDQLAAAEAMLRAAFRDRYAALQDAEDDSAILLRAALARLLAVVALDDDLRAAFATLAERRIGTDGAPANPSAVSPDILETVLSVGVQERGAPFFDALLAEALASDDPAFRGDALGALARTEDPALAARLRETAAGDELRGREGLVILFRQLARRATRADAWAWVQANGETVIAMSPASFRSQNIPSLGASFCSAERSAELSAFIDAHAAALPGYERSLAQTQEGIALCAALKDAAGDALAEAFSAH